MCHTDDDDEPAICGSCNGSGEGQYDGTRCTACGGRGTERPYDYGALDDLRFEEERQRRIDDEMENRI